MAAHSTSYGEYMTARRFMEMDCKQPQVLRQSYISTIMEKLIGYDYLSLWSVTRYDDSVIFTSKDGKRELKIDSDLVFTITARPTKIEARSNRFSCKTIGQAWSMCDATLKAYR